MTVKNMTSVMDSVQRSRSGVHGGVAGTCALINRKCVDGCGGHLVRDGLWLSSWELSERTKKARAAVPLSCWLAGAFDMLFRNER